MSAFSFIEASWADIPDPFSLALTTREQLCIKSAHQPMRFDEHMGYSKKAWARFNLASHVEDEASTVALNRQQLAQSIQCDLEIVQQVHGHQVCYIDQLGDAASCLAGADAMVSSLKKVALTILVADCLPILFFSSRYQLIAAAHAGWRGLADASTNVVESTLRAMSQRAGCSLSAMTQELGVWLGPCIGPHAFEVGPEVIKAASKKLSSTALEAIQTPVQAGSLAAQRGAVAYVNLALWAKYYLSEYGVQNIQGNDSTASWCTFSQEAYFFSHRRSTLKKEGPCGRMAALIWMNP